MKKLNLKKLKNTIHYSQLIELPENPTVDDAVRYMETAIDIVDWNLKRERIIRAVGLEKYLNYGIPSNNSYVSRIDLQGLITKVLKQNKKELRRPFYELFFKFHKKD